MKFAWRFLGFASCVYVVSAVACGGKVRSDQGGSGGADMGTTTGPTGPGTTTIGSVTTGTTGSTSTGTTGSTTTGAGGTGIDPRVTCGTVCQRLLQFPCYRDGPMTCVQACESSRTQALNCGPLFDELLLCLETSPISCGPNGELDIPACEPVLQKLDSCRTPPPPPIDAGPPSQCSVVPPGPMRCVGGGAATSGSSTSGGQPTCYTECTDVNMNTWASKCVGTSCTCTFNGSQYCTCFVADPCFHSCCPGAP